MGDRLRIYILGNSDDCLDEGEKNITRRLSYELSKRHNVVYSNSRENLFRMSFWKRIKRFEPEIVHIFLRINIPVLLYAKLLDISNRHAKVIISVLQPAETGRGVDRIMSILKPDLVIAMSKELMNYWKERGCRGVLLPCGVDTNKFRPVSKERKLELRVKYGVPLDKYVILHVGHATKGRNVSILKGIVSDEVQVIFITSESFNVEKRLTEDLKNSGCLVFSDYIKDIEELYQLSDCYAFVTLNDSNSIALPLSVLEAMACDLPVVATRLGALPELFREDGRFVFFDGTEEDLKKRIKRMGESEGKSSNRGKILGFEWASVGKNLECIYRQLIEDVR